MTETISQQALEAGQSASEGVPVHAVPFPNPRFADRLTKRVLVRLGALLALCLVALAMALNVSLRTDVYKCVGHLTKEPGSQAALLDVSWYSSWIRMLKNKYGRLALELAGKPGIHYDLLGDAKDVLMLRESTDAAHSGQFSLFAMALSIQTPYGVYDATCAHTSE
jgi:hypothetical protein